MYMSNNVDKVTQVRNCKGLFCVFDWKKRLQGEQ